MLEAYRTPDRLQARIAFHDRYAGAGEDFHRWLFSHAEAAADARVLEVGAGTSRLWGTNADRVPPGWRLTLTDVSEGMVEATLGVVADAGLSASVRLADVQSLPFGDGEFDLAFANHMLYHVRDLPRAVAELRRVLRPGGLLIAATNGAQHLSGLRELPVELADDAVTVVGSAGLSFTLENGGQELRRAFSDVVVLRRDDEVLADDPDLVLAYLRSMIYLPAEPSPTVAARLAAWEAGVRTRMAEGPLVVQRSSGFFLAR